MTSSSPSLRVLGADSIDTLNQLNAASIRYRIAVGRGAGGRTLTLKNPALARADSASKPFNANRDGFGSIPSLATTSNMNCMRFLVSPADYRARFWPEVS